MRRPSRSATLIAVLMAGCAAPDPDAPPTGTETDQDDTGSAGDTDGADCDETEGLVSALSAVETAVPTVFEVVWESEAPLETHVRFTFDEGESHTSPASETATSGTHLVLGPPASTEVQLRLVDADGRCSPLLSYTTGALPTALPTMTHTGSGAPDLGFLTVPIITDSTNYLTVIDSRGRYVWAQQSETLPWRMEGARDGLGFLVNSQAPSAVRSGHIMRYDWTGAELERLESAGIHTDFAETPDGLLYTLGWEVRDFEDDEGEPRRILGDTLVSIDPETLEVETLFNVFEHWSPDLTQEWGTGNYPDDVTVEDWSHFNGVSFDAQEDAILVSSSGLQSIMSIDRHTGELNWVLGSADGTLDHDLDARLINNPHSVYRDSSDEVVVFNRLSSGGDQCSTVDTIAVDIDDHSAVLSSSYVSPDCLSVYFLGQARPISEDRTMVVWSTSGRIDILDAHDETIWSITAELGAGMAYSDHLESLYP